MRLALAILTLFAIVFFTRTSDFLKSTPFPMLTLPSDINEDLIGDSIRHWLAQLHEQKLFNGGILISRNHDALMIETFGYEDAAQQRKLSIHSSFRLASVSKQFTAAGIMLLHQRGQLNYDSLVTTYIPAFPYEQVTVRHLLTMTSGIPDQYMSLAEDKKSKVGDTLTIQEAVQLIVSHPGRAKPPLTSYEYNNSNYILLAGIIEKLSGVSFEQFMKGNFFDPLDMKNTRVWNLMSEESMFPNKTESIEFSDSSIEIVSPTWLDGVSGDGGIFSSLSDMLIWDKFWSENTILLPETMYEALQPITLLDGTISNYGFGWNINEEEMSHTGSWLSARTYIYRNRKTNECLVVLDNSASTHIDDIVKELLPNISKLKSKNVKSILGLRTTIYRVPDLEKAKEWYAKAFETPAYFDEPFYVGFTIGGYELGLLPEEGRVKERTPNVESYWGVSDIAKSYQHFLDLGAKALDEPSNVGGEMMTATLLDPWDNVIGLIYNPYFKLTVE
jgi:CubicO group peptidase (beta-lactamase class C family)